MNTRKTSISHVINDNIPITSDQHLHQQQQSPSSVCSLKNILSDDSPVHTQQHASSTQQSPPSQQYNHGAGNSGSGGNNNSTVGYGGPYSNEQQVHDYYHPRSHQPPTSQPQPQPQQPSHNQLSQQHTQKEQFNEAEASSILLLLSTNNQPSSDTNYIPQRDPRDIEQQMPDVVETPNISNNIKSNSQQINRQGSKSNSMSITSICCGGESGPSESGNSSMQCGSSMETSKYQQPLYPEDTHHQPPIVDYNNLYNNHNRKQKKPSNGPIPLMVNTSQKIPQKEPKVIQKKASPQKRRPSDTSELIKPKIHHRNSESNHFYGPPATTKLDELRNQLGENRNDNRITPMVPIQAGMEWDRSHHSQHNQHTQHTQHTQYHQTRPSHNVPPPQAEINRYHPPAMPKNVNSPSLHGDSSKFNNYMNSSNERQLNKTSPNGPPVHVPNGYPHGHNVGPVGGMIGHPDVISQPSHQPHQPHQQPQPIPITQQQMPSLRGQNSAFSHQIHKKYNDMKHDPKMKRNAPHAYISYMIYTNQMQETGKGKDHLPPQQNNRIIQNGSPTLHNDAMMNPSMMPINGAIYNHRDHRESQHPTYHPIQPANGYIPSETVTNQGRRTSDPPMRNVLHGYPPTHVNGILDEHQSSSSHRHSISSHNSSPGLLPAHSSANSQQRSILPNLSSSQRHVPNNISPTISTSRSGSIPHQPPISTTLPPIQSAPSLLQQHHHHHGVNSQTHHHHYHQVEQHTNQNQNHAHHYHQPVSQSSQPPPPSAYMSVPPPLAPQHSSYNGKSSPAQPQPQSPINSSRQPNHYHHTSPGPLPQGGSNRLSSSHHHHHHHHQPTSEPVPLVNGSSQNILSPPLTRYLDSQSQSSGYGGSVHPHHQHLTNGVGLNHPVNIAPAQAQALGPPVPRGPSGYIY